MIRNITGYVAEIISWANGYPANDYGALYWQSKVMKDSPVCNFIVGLGSNNVFLDSSRVVPTGPQNAPETIAERWFRRVA